MVFAVVAGYWLIIGRDGMYDADRRYDGGLDAQRLFG
jgi:hypothetical protein